MKNIVIFIALMFATFAAKAQHEVKWPRQVEMNDGLMIYYQPQIDNYHENVVEGRTALSFKPNNGSMVFGAFSFNSLLQTDTEARTAILRNVTVTNLQFPSLEDITQVADLTHTIESNFESMNIVLSLDDIIEHLGKNVETSQKTVEYNNAPPIIYYRDKPAILVSIDGDPIWQQPENQNFKYVVNTPFFIVQDLNTNAFYIKGGNDWFTTMSPQDDWKITRNIPLAIREFANKNAPASDNQNNAIASFDATPEIIVVYEPSELISTLGAPQFNSIKNTSLLYVTNTSDDIILDMNSQSYYILLAGRWYKSYSLDSGEWSFVDPRDVPKDFANIPSDSDVGSVRASVPNTPEAKSALLEQTIPQTAEVVRSEASFEVFYDGQPVFKAIPNSGVEYALNSDKTVLRINNHYYGLENAVWFIAKNPYGPWQVSDHRPDEVDNIPPSEPVYHTKYVYVYDYTPEVVYVGYLPGYLNSYAYHGVVYYGTGYYYPYWYGSVFFPRRVTYGYHVHYTPRFGWGFSLRYSYGWFGWNYHRHYYHSYWSPAGYYAGYRYGYNHGYNRGYRDGYYDGYANGKYDGNRGVRNVYRNQITGVRNAVIEQQVSTRRDISRESELRNNVYADKSGRIYKNDGNGTWTRVDDAAKRTVIANPTTREANSTMRESGGVKQNDITRTTLERETTRQASNLGNTRQTATGTNIRQAEVQNDARNSWIPEDSRTSNITSPTRKSTAPATREETKSGATIFTPSGSTRQSQPSPTPSRSSVESDTRMSVPSRQSATPSTRSSSPSPSRQSATPSTRSSSPSPSRQSATPSTRSSSPSPSRQSATPSTRSSSPSPSRQSATPSTRSSSPSPSRQSATPSTRSSSPSPSRQSATPSTRSSSSSPSRQSATPSTRSSSPARSAPNQRGRR